MFVGCSSHGKPGVIVFKEENHRGDVPVSSHIGVHGVNMTLFLMLILTTWLRQYCPGFSTVQLLFHLVQIYSLESSH